MALRHSDSPDRNALEKAQSGGPRIGSSSRRWKKPASVVQGSVAARYRTKFREVTTLEELADFFVALSRYSIKSKAPCSP